MQETYYCYYDSPIGKLLLAGSKTQLSLLRFPQGKMSQEPEANWIYTLKSFDLCRRQLDEYFSGKRKMFDIPIQIVAAEFSMRVLQRVAKIPYGTTCSYSDIAQQLQNPAAVRAVAMANARNNLPIIIPCHRVIGKNGSLTGFGGGLEIKQALLDHEKEHCYGICVR
jgi:methylated-DNA-[protein]-cysteine S-methyltransferase